MRRLGLQAIFLATLLVAAGATAAEGAQLTVSDARFAAAEVEATPTLLYVVDGVDRDARDLEMTLSIEGLVGREKSQTTTSLIGPDAAAVIDDSPVEGPPQVQFDVLASDPNSKEITSQAANFGLVGFDTDFGILVHALPGSSLRAELGALETTLANEAMPCGQLIIDEVDDSCLGSPSDSYVGFHNEPVAGHQLISTSQVDAFTVTLEGDFRLQLMGIDLESGDEQVLRSTRETHRDHEASPVEETTRRSLDLHVSGGRLEISSLSLGGSVNWAAREQDVRALGSIVLSEAVGQVYGEPVDAASLRVPAPYELGMEPADDGRIGIEFRDEPSSSIFTSAIGVAPDQVAATTLILLGAASLLGLAGFGVFVAIRNSRQTMDDVEAAIEAKQYKRAARMAGRLQRKNPQSEDAAVARAVALSRAGAHARVVKEVQAHIHKRTPEDGVLHYILGLAHLEQGAKDDAFAHLKEAARLTPSLEMDVRNRIGRPPRPSRDHGAYA